jgi:hypothetical protein
MTDRLFLVEIQNHTRRIPNATVGKLLCWRRFALRLFLSEQSQQHFVSSRGILRALGEQLYIKRDVFVVGVTRHFDLHGSCAEMKAALNKQWQSEQV